MAPLIIRMGATRLLPAILFACVVYLSGALLVSGYSAESRDSLATHVARLEENLNELVALNARLVAEAELLQRSSDRIALEARRFGYYDEDLDVIRLEETVPVQTRSPGSIILAPAASAENMLYVRFATVLAFLVAYLLQSMHLLPVGSDRYEIRRASK